MFILILLIRNTDYSRYDMFFFSQPKMFLCVPGTWTPMGTAHFQPNWYQRLIPIKMITTAIKFLVVLLPLHIQAFVSNRLGIAERWNWTTWQYYQYFDLCLYVQTVLAERRLTFKTETFPNYFCIGLNLYDDR